MRLWDVVGREEIIKDGCGEYFLEGRYIYKSCLFIVLECDFVKVIL